MTTTITNTTPRVWIGCLQCYNEGKLVGDWYDAVDADEITTSALHGRKIQPKTHEELWVMDHENLPITGECSPHDAAELAGVMEEVPEGDRAALIAWVLSGDYVEDGDGLPSISDFEERYCGEWVSFREYAEQLGDDIGLLDDVPEEIARYFDWDAWTRDLMFDYTTEDAPTGVYVFRVM